MYYYIQVYSIQVLHVLIVLYNNVSWNIIGNLKLENWHLNFNEILLKNRKCMIFKIVSPNWS